MLSIGEINELEQKFTTQKMNKYYESKVNENCKKNITSNR